MRELPSRSGTSVSPTTTMNVSLSWELPENSALPRPLIVTLIPSRIAEGIITVETYGGDPLHFLSRRDIPIFQPTSSTQPDKTPASSPTTTGWWDAGQIGTMLFLIWLGTLVGM